MKILRMAAVGTILVAAAGCAEGGDPLGPADQARTANTPAAERNGAAARRVSASGEFVALVDFSTLTLTPRGRNCLLQVSGQLVFTGTIEGAGVGTTTAHVFAPCAEVASTPPGTFRDVFRSELMFDGTIDGEPTRARVRYMGRSAPGGAITGRLIFTGGARGRLEVDAQLAVGGQYRGSLVLR